jgi:hypothetical protein
VPSLVIEESDNKAEVEAETKAAKEIAGAFKRINRRNRRQYLFNKFIRKGDLLDFNSSGLGSKRVLGKSQRVEDPTLGGSSLEDNSVR